MKILLLKHKTEGNTVILNDNNKSFDNVDNKNRKKRQKYPCFDFFLILIPLGTECKNSFPNKPKN